MANKTKQEYKNIPVKPEVYEKVQLISKANGFGERGLGAQIAHWVGRELPECEHEKTPVSIESFSNDTVLVRSIIKTGYYCETCKRVYAKITEEELVEEDGKKLLEAVSVQRSAISKKKAVKA